MKLIEAIKNLKIIQKRIDKNVGLIRQYASYISSEAPSFTTEAQQRNEVQSLIQANIDLQNEYLRLKKAIERTNLETLVTINGYTYPISDVISIRRIVGRFQNDTFAALDTTAAMSRMKQVYMGSAAKPVDPANPPRVIALFDEKYKNDSLKSWGEFLEAIDGKMEVVNAETELLGY